MEISPYYDKKITCIHCKKTFTTTKVRSKFLKIAHSEDDFHPIYENDVYGYFYNIFVCEHCGFGFTEDFTTYFMPGTSDIIDQKITSKWVPHDFSGIRSHEDAIQAFQLALVCGQLKKERNVTLAGIALRCAWAYRELQQPATEKRFLKIARDQYAASFSNADYRHSEMTEERIAYMVAILNKKIGEPDAAIRYLSKIIEKQSVSTDLKIVEMAKQLWQDMRDAKASQR